MTPVPPSVLVLGVGNTLMSDDGAGVRLMERLRDIAPALPAVSYLDAGTLSFVLLPRIQESEALLVLDAARFDAPAGTTRAFSGEAMDAFLQGARCSVHEVGIRDLLDLARLTGTLPVRRAFVGIQPGETGWGESLSPAVEAALPAAAATARRLLEGWC
jgi:hydrogenase maturation protease